MSIIFSAIVPHPPILIPTIGKENIKKLKTTAKSFERLEHDLYAGQIDTIVIISPHGPLQATSFTLNLCPEYYCNFEDFGDFSTKFQLNGDILLAYKIREKIETSAPLQLISQQNLDHGSAVPLYFLTRHLPKISIVPFYYSGLDFNAHFEFGHLIKHELITTKKRIAVIASGDLSHRLTKDAPAGYNPKGKKFDKKLIELLTAGKTEEILKMNEDLIAEAGECGLRSFIILLGILSEIRNQPQFYSYEAPFGVGYLVMNFKI